MKTKSPAEVKTHRAAHAQVLPAHEKKVRAPGFGKQPAAAAPDALMTAGAKPAMQLDGARAAPKHIGPEAPGKPGDIVQAPRVSASAGEVLAAKAKLDAKIARDPAALAKLRTAPFPRSASAQLEWALARPSLPNLQNPVWTLATNDSRAALVAFAQGVVSAASAGIPVDDSLEAKALNAGAGLGIGEIQTLQASPFPEGAPLETQLKWALAMTYAWDWTSNPAVTGNPRAQALVSLLNGVMAKSTTTTPTVLASERKTLTVDGDTRVFAIHTPPGKPPANGWPTVMFFHGSFGGYAPEQNEEYQALNAIADARGFQVVYPVGLPQDRADAQTGRGMLNWDPVGAGPGGANDRFVHALIAKLTGDKGAAHADQSRIFAAGHSQGGFYTSDLVAAYPDVFAGATILGAGLGSIADGADLTKATRQTPTLLRVGTDDLHIGVGERLASRFSAFGDAFRFDRMPARGHEVLGEDLNAMLEFFAAQPSFTGSKAGKLDGKTGAAQPRPAVFRDALNLGALPPELRAQPNLVRALQALATNQYLSVDANAQTFTLAEWRLAQQYATTFPPAMQQSIEALRAFFVVAPPPANAMDLSHVPPELLASANATAALQALYQSPVLDLDGYPGFLSAEEVAASYDFKASFGPEVQQGIDQLRDYFFGGKLPDSGHDFRPRTHETLPGGAHVESYPGSDAAMARLRTLVEGLRASPRFDALMAKTTLVVSPPGKGLEALPEVEGWGPGVEGTAGFEGFTANGQTIPGPALIIREDSLRSWALGAAHELLHLLRADGGDAAKARIDSVWAQIGGRDGQPDGYPNSEEMLAYFGQWYLAGFGEELRQVSPEAFALCQELIGDAHIDAGAMTKADALTSLQGLLGWFRSGQHERA